MVWVEVSSMRWYGFSPAPVAKTFTSQSSVQGDDSLPGGEIGEHVLRLHSRESRDHE